jgi:carboxyl-terminal processing protease
VIYPFWACGRLIYTSGAPFSSEMTTRNVRLLIVVLVVCAFCYGNARRIRDLGDLALAMDIIDQEYVETPNREKLYQAAMKGMIDSLDPYSSYIPIESLKPFQQVFDQEFGGLGVSLEGPKRRDRLTVVSTLFDSPAYKAGIQPGDVILKIDGIDAATSEVDEVTKLLRGREGTSVRLLIERIGESKPIEVTVTRAMIEIESVLGDRRKLDGKWEYLMEADPRIAYLHIELFGEKTTDELRKAIASVKDRCRGVIIDLRDNTGGLLNSATEICDMFLDDGEMVSTRGRDGKLEKSYTAVTGTDIDDSVPIVVLINENSASASEVVAACLQDRCRATVVGSRSFGKGSVQNVIPLDGGLAAMRLTTAFYFPPSGRMIHRKPTAKEEDTWGVHPDPECEVKFDEAALLKAIERFRKRADPIANGFGNSTQTNPPPQPTESSHQDISLSEDAQLLKAVEVIEKKLQ